MKLIVKIIIIVLYLLAAFYLLYPDTNFPEPLPGALQSNEPADTETPLRRAYFTNFTREEVIAHYKKQFDYLPTLRLNYPPEDAQWIIRDQTRSYYLEELVHPLRSSIFINGFVPQQEKDAIYINGERFHQKLTIKYVPSNPVIRTSLFTLAYIVVILVIKEWKNIFYTLWAR